MCHSRSICLSVALQEILLLAVPLRPVQPLQDQQARLPRGLEPHPPCFPADTGVLCKGKENPSRQSKKEGATYSVNRFRRRGPTDLPTMRAPSHNNSRPFVSVNKRHLHRVRVTVLCRLRGVLWHRPRPAPHDDHVVELKQFFFGPLREKQTVSNRCQQKKDKKYVCPCNRPRQRLRGHRINILVGDQPYSCIYSRYCLCATQPTQTLGFPAPNPNKEGLARLPCSCAFVFYTYSSITHFIPFSCSYVSGGRPFD